MLNETLSLEAEMKLTNKILIGVFALLLAATTVLAIKFTSVVKYTPQPFKEKFVEITKKYSLINELEINGGYELQIYESEKDSLKFFGPDLLVTKYTEIIEQNGKLKIESKVNMANYPYYLLIKLYVRRLEGINVRKGATIQMWEVNGDTIKIIAKDSSIVKIGGCDYKYARLDASDQSIISLEKANEVSIRLKNESMLIISVGPDGMSGSKDKDATLIANGKKFDYPTFVAERKSKRMVKK